MEVRFSQGKNVLNFKNANDEFKFRKEVCENACALINIAHSTWHLNSEEENLALKKLVANTWERLCIALNSEDFSKYIHSKIKNANKWLQKMQYAQSNARWIVMASSSNSAEWFENMKTDNYEYFKKVREENEELFKSIKVGSRAIK